ncbi:hypothetical protein AB0N81_20350 [Streptomyces sp. NPDC093510]|uniref:hypothetical protein n=1 Tax=Streptomyces sp. NPDC093510 TaxID=3155199 RepID=UPI003446DA63
MVAQSKPVPPGGGPAQEGAAGQSGPDEPDGRTGQAPDPEGRRYFTVLFTVHLLLMLILVAIAVIGDSATALTVAGGGFIAYVSAMTLYARRDERKEVTHHLLAFLAAFTTAAVIGSVLWWALAARPDDVTDDARLTGGSVGAGATVRLDVQARPDGNGELRVSFTARDSAAGASPCLRMGKLRFQGKDVEAKAPVDLEETLSTTLTLHDPGPEVSVDIQLVGGTDCRVELTLEKAEYRR